ncbi:MAG TPA: phosphoenolpyruvate--protein phosphotransferase, partial [Clostridiales bacterium]|nr:phosphoenolpyruvate--protein phosphotransferase [Clostridiales bacterium]
MKGLGVSHGIGIGKVFKVEPNEIEVERIEVEDTSLEIEKLKKAIIECKEQINNIYEITIKNVGEKEAEIFKAHEMILEDEAVFDEVVSKIKIEKINCEFELNEVLSRYIRLFENIEDEYLRDRSNDLKDIMYRLTKIIVGAKTKKLSDIEDGTVIVAYDLTPSDTAQMDKDKVAAIIVETGGRTSHAAIIARTMEIPTVVGVDGICDTVE